MADITTVRCFLFAGQWCYLCLALAWFNQGHWYVGLAHVHHFCLIKQCCFANSWKDTTDPKNLESENNFHIVSINFIVQILKKKREFTSLRIDCPDGSWDKRAGSNKNSGEVNEIVTAELQAYSNYFKTIQLITNNLQTIAGKLRIRYR